MKIEPIDEIVPLTIGGSQVEENLHLLSLLLGEFRDYGSIIIRAIFLDDKGITTHLRAVISCLLRKVIEDIDAISILIKESSSDPCFLNLRRLYENHIYLKFILKEKKKSEERAKAYYVNYQLNKRKNAEIYDCSTPRGKEQRAKLQKDGMAEDLSFQSINCKNEVAGIERKLQETQYQYIKNEFDRIKKEKSKKEKKGKLGNHWYSLFGGPTNLAELSEDVKCSGLYFLYRQFSKYSHSENELENIDLQGADQAGLVQIRNPESAQKIVLMTLEFGYLSFYTALETLKPPCLKCFWLYYKKNIEPKRAELRDNKIINVIR